MTSGEVSENICMYLCVGADRQESRRKEDTSEPATQRQDRQTKTGRRGRAGNVPGSLLRSVPSDRPGQGEGAPGHFLLRKEEIRIVEL